MASVFSFMDPLLYCEENWDPIEDLPSSYSPITLQLDDELAFFFSYLTAKQMELGWGNEKKDDEKNPYLGCEGRRREAVGWMIRAAAIHGFSPVTALIAADFLDRCFVSGDKLRLHPERPWMAQLAAVACLSLAAKVEETHVPLIVDLQAIDAAMWTFEATTVRRMELLVLSALQWRMNPVTPFSFLLPLLAGERELLKKCENVLLAAVADRQWVRYLSSEWAVAALLHAGEVDASDRLMNFTNTQKEIVEKCSEVVQELMGSNKINFFICPRHNSSSSSSSLPPSPSGVIGSCFSFDSSSISGTVTLPPSVSSSPDGGFRPFKKPKNC